jgi:hypothetical protein
LVEDLPSIPGPKTVGAENYSRVLNAFVKRGWTGFEEQFDRVVPRDRADYVDVKRDILREPMFSLKAHWNMVEAVQVAKKGRKEFDDVCDRLFARMKAREASPPEEDPDDKPIMWRD